MNLPIILASASPARLELLQQLNIFPSKVLPSNIDEKPQKKELPHHLAYRLAFEKAHFVANQDIENSIIIGADTVVTTQRKILPKASSEDEVRFCLKLLSNKRHRIYTGICIIKKSSGILEIRRKIVQTTLKFKNISNKEIDLYAQSGEGLDKAGGYSIKGFAESFITFISGSHSNVVGLPLFETSNMLNSLGYKTFTTIS